MAQETHAIRAPINTEEVEDANLEMLREDLANNKPELLRNAASELLTAKRRLDNLVGVIDRHLRELDQHWTVGEDARTVKAGLRRLRESAADVSTTISEQTLDPDANQCLANPSGVAPALLLQAHTLSAFSGKNVPESADKDVNFLEGAFQGGVAGTIGGGLIGGPPGMVIGAVVGTLAGGVTALFTDGPFANLVGDSKEEQDRKAAKEHIRLLTEATEQNNRAFPAQLQTDIPQFDPLAPKIPKIPFNGGGGFDGTAPAGLNQSFTSPNTDLNGLGHPDQDGLRDPGLHQIPGLGNTDPSSRFPGGPGTDAGTGAVPDPGTDLNGAGMPDGPNLNTPSANTPDAPGTDVNAPRTSLAGLPDPSTSLPTTSAANTPGTPNTPSTPSTSGIGSPYGGGGGTGPGNGMASAANAAAAMRGTGNRSPMIPLIPPAGRGGQQEGQESTRTTWLLEDEDYFMSDEATTIPYLRGDSKGKA
ncbi:hypothetical protein EDD27_10279 [Nonomuraea polychroma]|uniref:Uncharacterized protein n=1 Tax=Nonomuraea polychroma TaxID=46176 RepID=A0A438MPA1_9ACTN|nr:hypothetical protein [Nonomuraea polychroma]RVX47349.1 hypothetical protein EDD27_10279 [Nonomuraea polychroma]